MLARLKVFGTVGCAGIAEDVGRLVMTDVQSGSIGANEDCGMDEKLGCTGRERRRGKGKAYAAATARPPGLHSPRISATSTSSNSVSGNRGTLNYWKIPLHLAWSSSTSVSWST